MLQALYCWLRTYLLERRDVASKAELARGPAAQGRPQATTMPGGNSATTSTQDGNVTTSGNAPQDIAITNASGQGGPHAAHEAASQDGERVNIGDASGSDAGAGGGDQASGRRNMGSGWPGSAVTAFEAAKDIMEVLRAKHQNLAGELEVIGIKSAT